MSAGTSEFFCLICLLLCSCTAQKIIRAKHGENVILPCKDPNKNINDITAVEWIRPGLDPEYVLLYRDGHFDPNNQHLSYKNRTDLQDKEMKDGNFSLFLKNVTKNDTGTYVCRVSPKGKNDLISTIFLKVYLSAQKITAELGQDVILPCKVPNINIITAVEWNRPGLDPEYVLLYQDGRFDPNNQHPSYQNRVDLQDKEMKDGDFSLILKNVKMEDRGTYECWVFQGQKNEPISIINLKVYLSEYNPWKTSTIVLGVPLVVIILSAAGFAVYKKLPIRKRNQEWQELLEPENNSEIKNQLQQEKEKNEAPENQLDELRGSNSDPSTELQQEKQRKEFLESHLKELDEMNFDTNSDPTGSDEKNQQEELEKLQDENQKWMKTVGNLKTDHQDMNQELELMGTKTAEHVHE